MSDIKLGDLLSKLKDGITNALNVKGEVEVVNEVNNPLPSQLYAIDEDGNKVPVKISPTGEVLTQVTGSYVGYSSDDKSVIVPNPQRNNDFLELDTGDLYVYDGTSWVVLPE